MAGEIKFLRFSDGSTVAAPSALSIDIATLTPYADDTAFETTKGSGGAAGDIYFNTTDNEIKFHNGSAWATVIDSVEIANYTPTSRNVNTSANSGLAGGGSLAADKELVLDVSNLVAESTLDAANDYIPFYDDSAGAMRKVLTGNVGGSGGGSGTGAVNYVTNSDFEIDVSDWNTYDDGPVAIPVDGTGGAPTAIAISRETTSVLRGTGSLKIAKSAANGQGEGVSTDLSIDSADRNRLMRLSFELDGSHANYVAGDLVCYLISDTGGTPVVVTPSVTNLPSGKAKYEALVVTDSQDDWRLCFHIATTNASDYDIYIDDVLFTPELTVSANPTSEPIVFTPTQSTATPSTINTSTSQAYHIREGSTAKVYYNIKFSSLTGGTGTAFLLDLPTGLNIDLTYHKVVTGGDLYTIPGATANIINHSTGAAYDGAVYYDLSDDAFRIFGDDGASVWIIDSSSGSPVNFSSSDTLTVNVEYRVAEWAGSVVTTANSRVEYAYNSETVANTPDTNSFAYGPSGTGILAHTSDTNLRVRFQTSIQETDTIVVQIRHNGSNYGWQNVGNSYMGFNRNTSTNSGIWINNVNSTDVDVYFGADGAYSGRAWSSETGTEWRVVKCSNPLGIGTGVATATQAGAVSAEIVTTESTLPTLTWDGITAPTVVSSGYMWHQVGKIVKLQWMLFGSSSSSDHTICYFALPSEIPRPKEFSFNAGTGHRSGMGTGYFRNGDSGQIEGQTYIYLSGSEYRAYTVVRTASNGNFLIGEVSYIVD